MIVEYGAGVAGVFWDEIFHPALRVGESLGFFEELPGRVDWYRRTVVEADDAHATRPTPRRVPRPGPPFGGRSQLSGTTGGRW